MLAPRSGPPQVRRACCHIFSARSEAAENAWPRHIAASASRRPSMSASARERYRRPAAPLSRRGLAWSRRSTSLAPHDRIAFDVRRPPSLSARRKRRDALPDPFARSCMLRRMARRIAATTTLAGAEAAQTRQSATRTTRSQGPWMSAGIVAPLGTAFRSSPPTVGQTISTGIDLCYCQTACTSISRENVEMGVQLAIRSSRVPSGLASCNRSTYPPPPSPRPPPTTTSVATAAAGTCRSDICGDIGNDCCAPGSERKSCRESGYTVTTGGTTTSIFCPRGSSDIYQCCPSSGRLRLASSSSPSPIWACVLHLQQRRLVHRRRGHTDEEPRRLGCKIG